MVLAKNMRRKIKTKTRKNIIRKTKTRKNIIRKTNTRKNIIRKTNTRKNIKRLNKSKRNKRGKIMRKNMRGGMNDQQRYESARAGNDPIKYLYDKFASAGTTRAEIDSRVESATKELYEQMGDTIRQEGRSAGIIQLAALRSGRRTEINRELWKEIIRRDSQEPEIYLELLADPPQAIQPAELVDADAALSEAAAAAAAAAAAETRRILRAQLYHDGRRAAWEQAARLEPTPEPEPEPPPPTPFWKKMHAHSIAAKAKLDLKNKFE